MYKETHAGANHISMLNSSSVSMLLAYVNIISIEKPVTKRMNTWEVVAFCIGMKFNEYRGYISAFSDTSHCMSNVENLLIHLRKESLEGKFLNNYMS
jgi:hypothetical protein